MPPEDIDSLDRDSLKPLLLSLLKQNEQLLVQVETLLARIAVLEGRAGPPPKTPTNSSLPPSAGQKSNVPPLSGAKKRRKGRTGVARELCTSPDQTRDVYADRCACGAAVSPAEQTLAHAYDHIDLPPIKPVTTILMGGKRSPWFRMAARSLSWQYQKLDLLEPFSCKCESHLKKLVPSHLSY